MTEKKTVTVSTPLPQREGLGESLQGEGVGLSSLYEQSRELICRHSSAVMNAVRE